jgi:hypothetical protein
MLVFCMVFFIPPNGKADIRVNELSTMWTQYYDDFNIRENHPNRKNFCLYAKYVVESLDLLKKEYYASEGYSRNLKIKYPEDDSQLHLLIGAMAIKETSVTPRLVGKRGEVGLLQVHGVAQDGHHKRVIRENPRTGIHLGIRWLLHCLSISDKEINSIDDYGYGLTNYICGPKCKGRVIRSAKERIKLVKKYAYTYGGTMQPIEILLEALSYQFAHGELWYETEMFDNKLHAKKILNRAKNSKDEELKEHLVDLYFEGLVLEDDYTTMFKKMIKEMKDELK